MEVYFRNCGEIVSLSDVARTHARVPYSSPGLMVVHFESVRLKKMSRTLENLAEMMSQHILKSLHFFTKDFQTLLAQILLQLDVLEKEYLEFDLEKIVN